MTREFLVREENPGQYFVVIFRNFATVPRLEFSTLVPMVLCQKKVLADSSAYELILKIITIEPTRKVCFVEVLLSRHFPFFGT